MGEFEFIDWLDRQARGRGHSGRHLWGQVDLPIGDDCAFLHQGDGNLFAADMLMDGVHFDLHAIQPDLVGRKALAVNLSDIAAMAGVPTAVTVCLALPKTRGAELARSISGGILDLARTFDVALVGGDTNTWNGPLVISIAILGQPGPSGIVRRDGAKAGDWICVTGHLGDSLPSGRHLTFMPRVKEARLLHQRYGLTAMIDLSDGLAADLRHVLRASGVGGRLTRAAIPVAASLTARLSAAAARHHALTDGEDFELCFTLPAASAERLVKDQPFGPSLPVTVVGIIESVNDPGQLLWEDGELITAMGYRHRFADD